MATFQIYYAFSGRCGSGTSNSYGWSCSEPRGPSGWTYSNGTVQFSCSGFIATQAEATLRQTAINYATPYWRQGDNITINGSPYDPFAPICPPDIKVALTIH